MSWKPEIEELKRRRALAQEMGGPEKVERQHHFGKLTVRERIDAMIDAGSFHEVGEIAGRSEYTEDGELVAFRPSNFVFGMGEIDGRPAIVSGDDSRSPRPCRLPSVRWPVSAPPASAPRTAPSLFATPPR